MSSHPATMARVAALLYMAGGAVITAALVLPHPATMDRAGLSALLVVIGVIGCLLWLAGERLPRFMFPLAAAVAAVLVSVGIYMGGKHDGGGPVHFELLYMLVALFGAYFFGRVVLTGLLLFIGLSYVVVLNVGDPTPIAVSHWCVLMGTLAAGAAVVRGLRERLDALIERLHEAARTDYLTGLFNRRGFVERFDHELEVARRSGRPLCLLIGDLDRFKDLNDRFGHPAGDEVLVSVASMIDQARRRIDTAGRIGGEEFALLAPFTDSRGGLTVAERLREQVKSTVLGKGSPGGVRRGVGPSVTMSVGVASFPADGQTVEALMHAADRALYSAKEQGRDRSVVFKAGSIPKYAQVEVAVQADTTRPAPRRRAAGPDASAPPGRPRPGAR